MAKTVYEKEIGSDDPLSRLSFSTIKRKNKGQRTVCLSGKTPYGSGEMELWVELHAGTKQGTLNFKAILPKEILQNHSLTMLADTPLKVHNIH